MPKNTVGEHLCAVIEKIPAAKYSRDEKVGIKIFRRKFFCLTLPNSFAGEHFCAVFQKISGSEKDDG